MGLPKGRFTAVTATLGGVLALGCGGQSRGDGGDCVCDTAHRAASLSSTALILSQLGEPHPLLGTWATHRRATELELALVAGNSVPAPDEYAARISSTK